MIVCTNWRLARKQDGSNSICAYRARKEINMFDLDWALGAAEEIVPLLLELPGVGGVALFGSVARLSSFPGDIDFVLLMKNEKLSRDALDRKFWEALGFGGKGRYDRDLVEVLSLLLPSPSLYCDEAIPIITLADNFGVPINLILMPMEPTEEFVRYFALSQRDVSFLSNVAEDFLPYDKEKRCFDFSWDGDAPWEKHLPIYPGGIDEYGRPHWGSSQVRTLSGVARGNILIEYLSPQQLKTEILILGDPYQNQAGEWWVDIIACGIRGLRNLADWGVVQNPNGTWNSTNWLSRMGRKRVEM